MLGEMLYILFQKAQCAKTGDPSKPWKIGSERFASIQCYNGPGKQIGYLAEIFFKNIWIELHRPFLLQ